MAPKRILVVEDEGVIAMELAATLREFGYDVVGAANDGAGAVALAAEFKPDLVMMDIVIRGPVDGIEAAARIRAARDVPVVFLTAYGDQKTLARAKAVAPYGYLLKPYRPDDLRATIEMTLNRHDIERALAEQRLALAASEDALRQSEARLKEAQRIARLGSWDRDLRTDAAIWSDEIFRILELDRSASSFQAFLGRVHPDDRETVERIYTPEDSNQTAESLTYRLRMPDGRVKYVRQNHQVNRDDAGLPIRTAGTIQDITEIWLREQWTDTVIRSAGDAIIAVDRQFRVLIFNPEAEKIFGYSAGEVIGKPLDMLLPEASRAAHSRFVEEFVLGAASTRPMAGRPAIRGRRKDGSEFPAEASIARQVTHQGTLLTAVLRDITERVQMVEEIRRSEAKFRTMAEAMPFGVVITTLPDGVIKYANAASERILGAPPGGLLAQSAGELYRDLQFRQRLLETVGHHGEVHGYEVPLRRLKTGEPLWVMQSSCRVTFEGRSALLSGFHDITEKKNIELELERHRERLREAHQIAGLGSWERDLRTQRAWWSDEARAIIGIAPDESDISQETFVEKIHPEDRHRAATVIGAAVSRRETYDLECRIVDSSGKTRLVHITSRVVHDASGQPTRRIGTVQDVTAQRALQNQLRQSQKLEAIGYLAGGIAHDFNNILAGIVANLDVLALRYEGKPEDTELIERAMMAAEQGAASTQRLLAFARKQPLHPVVTDVSALVAGMLTLVRQTLGEHMEVTIRRTSDVWPCLVDPGQLENAVLNLAINARDAMPTSGRLTVEVMNTHVDGGFPDVVDAVAAGDYVLIAVADTGTGMSPDVAARAFEPFFTTKELGKGTGLGLSMVYGFARQSGGYVRIVSEVGHGTTVKLYLPRTAGVEEPKPVAVEASLLPNGTGQKVLVVEDAGALRELTIENLVRLGYTAVGAADGAAALAELRRSPDVALLLTDVRLPEGMNGFDVAREALNLRPALPIVFMSGFSDRQELPGGSHTNHTILLAKPFRLAKLARAIADALAKAVP